MDRITSGVHKFHNEIAPNKLRDFRKLARGQQPEALLITCSDSRIVPSLITQTDPGLIFVIRTAGNIVPPHGAAVSGEAATIEYAVQFLKIGHIIVCGHTCCGAMQGLSDRSAISSMPLLDEWLHYAQPSLDAVREKNNGPTIDVEDLVRENVLKQMANLKTYPFVRDAISEHNLTLHGWIFEIETACVLRHDAQSGEFVPLDASAAPNKKALLS